MSCMKEIRLVAWLVILLVLLAHAIRAILEAAAAHPFDFQGAP
jgi:hypothetical protein